MAETIRSLENLEWVGGHPALNYVNTVHAWAGKEAGQEYLNSYPVLVSWHRTAELITLKQARDLARTPADQNRVMTDARELRGVLRKIFVAVAHGRVIPRKAMSHVESLWRQSAKWRRLDARGGRVRMAWEFDKTSPDVLLGIIADEAVGLLMSDRLGRIKECPPPGGCGWLFLDQSRNKSRHWCSMKTCGNQAKIRRFRQKA